MNIYNIYVSVNDEEYLSRVTVRGNSIKIIEAFNDDCGCPTGAIEIDGFKIIFDEDIVAIEDVTNNKTLYDINGNINLL